MVDKYGLLSRGNQWRSLRNEEFQEQEVWDIFVERECYGSKVAGPKDFSSFSFCSSSSLARPIPSASRMIPRPTSKNNNSDITSQEPRVIQQSAPVNIPDWSKIYGRRKKVTKRFSWIDVDDDDDDASGVMHHNGDYTDEEEEDEEDDDDDLGMKLPPHEVIARRFARTQISSFSVFEGVGRTLKGRDLSKVRNAVLTKTGFLE